MSEETGVVTARDLLEWVADQGLLTRDGVRQGVRWRGPGVDGPWDAVVDDLVRAVDVGLGSAGDGIELGPCLDGLEEYVERRWLRPIVDRHGLSPLQAEVVLGIAEDLRLLFDATVSIGAGGLDAPLEGDLYYFCTFDYRLRVPAWAVSRTT